MSARWRFKSVGPAPRRSRQLAKSRVGKGVREERSINTYRRARLIPGLRDQVTDVLVSFRETLSEKTLLEAVVTGEARVIVNPLVANELEAELGAVISQTLDQALDSGVEIGLRFATPALANVPVGLTTDAAAFWVQRQGASAALGINQQSLAGIRSVLTRGLTDQLAPVDVAQSVGRIAGLDPRRAQAVENFRLARIRALAPTAESLTPAVQRVIDKQTLRFRDRQLLDRGRTIAETEIQAAITEGEAAFWERGILEGDVDAELLFKTWRTVEDARVCPICDPLHAQTIPFGDPFMTSIGARKGPPVHPRCRCFLQYGELDGETVKTQPDKPRARQDQENRRLLDRGTVNDDLGVASRKGENMAARRDRMKDGSKGRAKADDLIAVNATTQSSLRARLRDLDG